ncbi:MAG TPA: SRPBCC domain-containing protein [Terriglobia bacterium]|nr:SRPBCC domain-containing protein [Terriglobia bacterium]
MKSRSIALLGLVGLAAVPAIAQRSKAAAETQPSYVEVTRSATLRATIATDPASVFDYLVDSNKLETWFPDQAVSEAQLGGRYHFRWNDSDGVWSGRYTNFIRGNTLAYTWQAPGDEYETSVLIKLIPQAGGTLVELTHSGFTSNAALDKAIKAWVFYLDNLRSVIEDNVDLRAQQRQKQRARPSRSTKRSH